VRSLPSPVYCHPSTDHEELPAVLPAFIQRMRKTAFLLALFFTFAAFAELVIKPVGKLTKVETKTVCMINEQAMGKDQIPVEIEGRTYYGCCEMCKKALSTDASRRVSFDPVTGKQVDKAKAVIAAQEDGRVFYFESDETLAKYNSAFTN
jgi:YHS domain-containing protein